MRPIEQIVIHHSASSLETTVEQIASWHEANPNIGRMGYHLIILGNGRVFQGCHLERIGAHAKGYNLKSIGICVVGNNTKPEHAWTTRQINSLRALIDLLKIFWPHAEVLGHRDLSGATTECPGLNVRALLEKEESWTLQKSAESSEL